MKAYATPSGTARFKERFSGKVHESFFRETKDGLWLSSIGMGSYLGDPDEKTDGLYKEALKKAVHSGVNVIDTAINYRCQRSERSFGTALAQLFSEGLLHREEIFICTKGGFLPFDEAYPADPEAYFQKTYFESGLLNAADVIGGCHSLSPDYLEDQLRRSLLNLGIDTIDLYYLHNPETQLAEVSRREFLNRIRKAFSWLEEKVKEGRIRIYGTATWSGFRAAPDKQDYLSIEELQCLAREASGAAHHFRAVQLPLNLAMPEAWISPNQSLGANQVPFLKVAARTGLMVMASASLFQGKLAGPLPSFLETHFKNLPESSQKAIQFTRSVPGITSALVGMKAEAHVAQNLVVSNVEPLSENELFALFQQAG